QAEVFNMSTDDCWLISQPNLMIKLDVSRARFYRLRDADPTFPTPIKHGNSRQASAHYIVHEVEQWIEARKAARVGT
ncbi:hypothetical protein ABTB34_21090, partial [Acinetobacter baumannii]